MSREDSAAVARSRGARVVEGPGDGIGAATINRVFPRLTRPVLPGFNFVLDADVSRAAGGFPNVPNEDAAFSRRLSARGDVAYHPDAEPRTRR